MRLVLIKLKKKKKMSLLLRLFAFAMLIALSTQVFFSFLFIKFRYIKIPHLILIQITTFISLYKYANAMTPKIQDRLRYRKALRAIHENGSRKTNKFKFSIQKVRKTPGWGGGRTFEGTALPKCLRVKSVLFIAKRKPEFFCL